MSGPIFEIEDLSIDSTRGGIRTRIVDQLSLSVRTGEVYGLVGESGSGKSISMMASVGLASPGLDVVSGQVTFDGKCRDAPDQRALRRHLSNGAALLFQNAKGALTPFLTAGRLVERTLRSAGRSRNLRGEVVDLFQIVGLNHADHGHKYPHQISGGQAQRVAMACALATQPRLLIADEPTTALDVTTEGELLRFLAGLCRERDLAIVLIAHNLSLVSEHCAKLSIMHAGQIVETGERDRVFDGPLHPYTQGLITAVPDLDDPKELVPLNGSVWGGPVRANRCRFSHRCSYSRPECDADRPPEVIRPGQSVRCVLYDEIPT